MKLPEYITVDEVKRVCTELGIRDWTTLTEPKVLPEEARKILTLVNVEGMEIKLEDFQAGLEVELEHGLMFKDANVTNNHPVLTGKIVLAHFKETLDYYHLLEVAEIEGDIIKAVVAGNAEKALRLQKKLVAARLTLNQVEMERLSGS